MYWKIGRQEGDETNNGGPLFKLIETGAGSYRVSAGSITPDWKYVPDGQSTTDSNSGFTQVPLDSVTLKL